MGRDKNRGIRVGWGGNKTMWIRLDEERGIKTNEGIKNNNVNNPGVRFSIEY